MITKICKSCQLEKEIKYFSKTGLGYKGMIYRNNNCNECIYLTRKQTAKNRINIIDLSGEVWLGVYDYEEFYAVSNMGRFKSIDRYVYNGHKMVFKPSELHKGAINKDGYCMVKLSKEGTTIMVGLHRLVAKAFILNPDNLPEVNHKLGIKTDNRASELEWCDGNINAKHRKEVLNGYDFSRAKRGNIVMTNEFGENEILQSVAFASRKYNLRIGGIRYALKNDGYKYKGHYFKYEQKIV